MEFSVLISTYPTVPSPPSPHQGLPEWQGHLQLEWCLCVTCGQTWAVHALWWHQGHAPCVPSWMSALPTSFATKSGNKGRIKVEKEDGCWLKREVVESLKRWSDGWVDEKLSESWSLMPSQPRWLCHDKGWRKGRLFVLMDTQENWWIGRRVKQTCDWWTSGKQRANF